jgi:hypothetical protein
MSMLAGTAFRFRRAKHNFSDANHSQESHLQTPHISNDNPAEVKAIPAHSAFKHIPLNSESFKASCIHPHSKSIQHIAPIESQQQAIPDKLNQVTTKYQGTSCCCYSFSQAAKPQQIPVNNTINFDPMSLPAP